MRNLVHICFSSRRGDMSWLYCNFAFRKKGLGGGEGFGLDLGNQRQRTKRLRKGRKTKRGMRAVSVVAVVPMHMYNE